MHETRRSFMLQASSAVGVAAFCGGKNAMASESPWVPVTGKFMPLGSFPSQFVAAREVDVWIPDGVSHATPSRVIYVHDGKNFFDPATSYSKVSWRMDEAMTTVASEGIDPAIVVAIASPGEERPREYNSAHLWNRLSPETRAVMARSNGGECESEQYLAFLTQEVMPHIEANFPVRTDRDGTFLLGASMGALTSLETLASFPARFGGAGCVSAHLMAFGPYAEAEELRPTPAQMDEVARAVTSFVRYDLPPPEETRIWIDRGTEELDQFYPPFHQAFVDGAIAAGFEQGQGFHAEVFDGTGHHERDWARRLPDVLRFLLG